MTALYNEYQRLLDSDQLKADEDQLHAINILQNIAAALEAVPPRGSVIWRALGRKPKPVRGLYMWGGVGRGKSMLMDLFFDNVDIIRKRRAHFHEFMIYVHARLRVEREKEAGDPITPVVKQLADESRLLCFDEMVVNNMADAAIMSRLFTGLIAEGVTIITTSNRAPDQLYKNGLNRELFLPFIALLQDKLEVLALNGSHDYRRERLGSAALWHCPNGEQATKALSDIFFRLTDFSPEDGEHVPSLDLYISDKRTLFVPKALKGVAVFSFKKLCGAANGAADYLAIARHFHTVILVGIPVLGPENRNEAARFVTLIDALYEYRVKLLVSADTLPENLYPIGDGRFEFDRTLSRLAEMQSDSYLNLGHGITETAQNIK